MNRYVLTGAEGAGKTSIALALEGLGEPIVREAGADFQRLEAARGDPFPCERPDFAERILALQAARERRVSGPSRRVFLDRAMPDSIAYAAAFGWPLSRDARALAQSGRYDAVFLIAPVAVERELPMPAGRREAAARLVDQLVTVYRGLGHEPTVVPALAVDERARFVLAAAAALERAAGVGVHDGR